MVVEVVAREVGEDTSRKAQAADALLVDGVAAAFHEGVFATCICHLPEQAVERHGIGCGVRCFDFLSVNVVADGGAEAAFVAEGAEHIVQYGGDGRLAVGACDTHEAQTLGGFAVELMGYCARGPLRIGRLNAGDAVGWELFGKGIALQDSGCASGDGLIYIGVAIGLGALHGNEEVACFHQARIYANACYGEVRIAKNLERGKGLEEFVQLHI